MPDTAVLAYIDGEFLPAEQAKISVYDHGLLYGDGIFEGVRAYRGVAFQLREHIDRLYRSARAVRLVIPVDRDEMVNLVRQVLARNGLQDAYVRLLVTRGAGNLGPDPRTCPRPSIIILAEPLQPLHGDGATARGISAMVVSVRRDAVDATSHEVKSLSYMNSVMARLEATAAGADEAIFLDSRGFVSESPVSNVFVVLGDRLCTPSVSSGILHGITRALVMTIGRRLGLHVEERDITPYELLTAEEVFLTGTHAEIVPVVMVNGIPIGTAAVGPHTRSVIAEFHQLRGDTRYGVPIDTKGSLSHDRPNAA